TDEQSDTALGTLCAPYAVVTCRSTLRRDGEAPPSTPGARRAEHAQSCTDPRARSPRVRLAPALSGDAKSSPWTRESHRRGTGSGSQCSPRSLRASRSDAGRRALWRFARIAPEGGGQTDATW